MPVILPHDLPAFQELLEEGCSVVGSPSDDVENTLRIGLLNLMPLKQRTEKDFVRALSDSPFTIKLDLITTGSYRGSHTSTEHLDRYYKPWSAISAEFYDGFIITGAPVENLPFEQVAYWAEICEIIDWCERNVSGSVLHICWGAFASLYHRFGINKRNYPKKLSGVYDHDVDCRCGLFEGLTEGLEVPHSRNTYIAREDIERCPELKIVSYSVQAGIHCVMGNDGKDFYITGHSEYHPDTLDMEYQRDLAAGLNPDVPENYYPDDNPSAEPIARWCRSGRIMFSNWIKHYVASGRG